MVMQIRDSRKIRGVGVLRMPPRRIRERVRRIGVSRVVKVKEGALRCLG
jgi:hypothetical protein